MLDMYWLGGGLDWISNVCHAVPLCAMLKMYHIWELIIQVWQSPDIRRKGGGSRGSAISTWCLALCWQCCCVLSAYSHTTWHWGFPTLCVLLAYWAGTTRASANLWVQCKSGVVFPLKSTLFPLHLHLCIWDPDLVQGDRSFICPFMVFVAGVLVLREHVSFHWNLNLHRNVHYGLKLT